VDDENILIKFLPEAETLPEVRVENSHSLSGPMRTIMNSPVGETCHCRSMKPWFLFYVSYLSDRYELIASYFLQSKESMIEVMKSVDRANGYPFSDLDDNKGNFSQLMSSAVGTDFEFFRLVHK